MCILIVKIFKTMSKIGKLLGIMLLISVNEISFNEHPSDMTGAQLQSHLEA